MDLQFLDKLWFRGKSCDTFVPIGPHLVTPTSFPDVHKLGIELRLNGQVMQKSNTENIIFPVPVLIAQISQLMTFEPGDIIATGTPGGVGFMRKPPVFMKPRDVVEIDLEGIGSLRNPVAAPG